MEKRTPRQSRRLRKKNQHAFEMPSREKVLDEIEASPYKNLDQLRPKKLINNLVVTNYRYNNKDDLPSLSDDSDLEEFIDSSDELSPKRKRYPNKENIGSSGKKPRRQNVVVYGSDDEDQLQDKRRSTRISGQPKKDCKYDKKKALDKIFEREPDLKEVIDSDDADSFVCEDDEDEFESQETGTVDVEGNPEETDRDERRERTKTSQEDELECLEEDSTNTPGVEEIEYILGDQDVGSSDAVCRLVPPSNDQAGQHTTGKNISPVDLRRRQDVGSESSGTEVIDVSSAESHGGITIAPDVMSEHKAEQAQMGISSKVMNSPSPSKRGDKTSVEGNFLLDNKQGYKDYPSSSGKSTEAEENAGTQRLQMSNAVRKGKNDSIDNCFIANGENESHTRTNQDVLQKRADGLHKEPLALGMTLGGIDQPHANILPEDDNQVVSNRLAGAATDDVDNRHDCSVGSDPSIEQKGKVFQQLFKSKIEGNYNGESSDSDSGIRTGQALRSRLHHRRQVAKSLDSGEESSDDSDGEINTSFAQRQKKDKKRSVTIDSSSDDDVQESIEQGAICQVRLKRVPASVVSGNGSDEDSEGKMDVSTPLRQKKEKRRSATIYSSSDDDDTRESISQIASSHGSEEHTTQSCFVKLKRVPTSIVSGNESEEDSEGVDSSIPPRQEKEKRRSVAIDSGSDDDNVRESISQGAIRGREYLNKSCSVELKRVPASLVSGNVSGEESEEGMDSSIPLKQKKEKRRSVTIDSSSDDDDVRESTDQGANSQGSREYPTKSCSVKLKRVSRTLVNGSDDDREEEIDASNPLRQKKEKMSVTVVSSGEDEELVEQDHHTEIDRKSPNISGLVKDGEIGSNDHGSVSDSQIRKGQTPHCNMHHGKFPPKSSISPGDDNSEDSDDEINISYTRRQQKERKKLVTIDSDSDYG